MAKGKKKKEEEKVVKPFIITAAAIKDDFCNYTKEITDGIGIGDIQTIKGTHIVMGAMTEAFEKFNVHLACIDDVFEHAEVEINNIDKFRNNELAASYSVSGFKIKGSAEDESIILIGTKHSNSGGGRISFESPRILLGEFSAYKWWNELKEISDNVRFEVEEYHNGKYVPKEETQVVDKQQLNAFTDGQENDFSKNQL